MPIQDIKEWKQSARPIDGAWLESDVNRQALAWQLAVTLGLDIERLDEAGDAADHATYLDELFERTSHSESLCARGEREIQEFLAQEPEVAHRIMARLSHVTSWWENNFVPREGGEVEVEEHDDRGRTHLEPRWGYQIDYGGLLQALARSFGADTGYLGLLDPLERHFDVAAWYPNEELEGLHEGRAGSCLAWSINTKCPYLTGDVTRKGETERVHGWFRAADDYEPRSILCVPLLVQHRDHGGRVQLIPIGGVSFEAARTGAFDREHLLGALLCARSMATRLLEHRRDQGLREITRKAAFRYTTYDSAGWGDVLRDILRRGLRDFRLANRALLVEVPPESLSATQRPQFVALSTEEERLLVPESEPKPKRSDGDEQQPALLEQLSRRFFSEKAIGGVTGRALLTRKPDVWDVLYGTPPSEFSASSSPSDDAGIPVFRGVAATIAVPILDPKPKSDRVLGVLTVESVPRKATDVPGDLRILDHITDSDVRDTPTWLWGREPCLFRPDGPEIAYLQALAEALAAVLAEKQSQLEVTEATTVTSLGRDYLRPPDSAAADALSSQVARCAVGGRQFGVLLVGGTGTGKTLIARRIFQRVKLTLPEHERADAQFIQKDLSTTPKSLIEGALFGWEEGAFTGAVKAQPGLLAQVKGGVLLLDEVQDVPRGVLRKLLVPLEEREILPLGKEASPVKVNFHLVVATNKQGKLHKLRKVWGDDLWNRIAGRVVFLPSLQHLAPREEDFTFMAQRLAQQTAAALVSDLAPIMPGILKRDRAKKYLNVKFVPPSDKAIDELMRRDKTSPSLVRVEFEPRVIGTLFRRRGGWPGNVRQLKRVLWRGLVESVAENELRVVPDGSGWSINFRLTEDHIERALRESVRRSGPTSPEVSALERRILDTLSSAATPMKKDALLRAIGRPGERDWIRARKALSRRGLIQQDGRKWRLAGGDAS